MLRRARLLIVGLAVCLQGPALAAEMPDPPAPEPHLLIISIDGFPYDGFEPMRGRLPALDSLARRGVVGRSRTVFPSMTWPSHTSLVTGVVPAKHGVLGNRYFDRRRRGVRHASTVPFGELVKVPAIWDLARDAGMTSAATMWAMTQSAEGLTWNIPESYSQKTFRRGSTPGWLEELRDAGLPTQRLGRFSERAAFLQDSLVRDIAVHLVETHRPRVNLVHFLSVDSLSHSYGPDTPMVRWAMELTDRYVGDILAAYERAGLAGQTHVMIVSDHGFLRMTKAFDADRVLHEAGLLRNLKRLNKGPVRTVANGHALYVYVLDRKGRAATARQVANLFRAFGVIEKTYLPSTFASLGLPTPTENPHMPDLVVLSKPHVKYGRARKGDTPIGPAGVPGMHGYLPDHPALMPLFIAAGPRIRPQAEHVAMDNLDVAPTAARLMGLAFETPVDGAVREDLLLIR